MKFKTTLLLLGTVVALVIVIGISRERDGRAAREHRDRLVPVSREDVTQFAIDTGDLSIECTMSNGRWSMTRPVSARARHDVVSRILATFEELPLIEEITVEEMEKRGLTPADYGFTNAPRARIRLTTPRKTVEFMVGLDTPFDDNVYAMRSSGEAVIVTSTNVLGALPTDLDLLRERKLVDGAVTDVTRFEIERSGGGFVDAARHDDGWVMRQPVRGAQLSDARVLHVMRELFALEATGFVDGIEPELAGLSDGMARFEISVWSGDEQTVQTLRVGRDTGVGTGEVYVKRQDGDLVYTVSSNVLSAFAVRANDLRETSVFPIEKSDIARIELVDGGHKLEMRKSKGWRIIAPRDWSADRRVVEELLGMLTALSLDGFLDGAETNLAAYGLEPGGRSITVSAVVPATSDTPELVGPASPAGGQEPERSAVAGPGDAPDYGTRLVLGSELDDRDGMYARMGGDSSVFTLSGDELRHIMTGVYARSGVDARDIPGAGAGGRRWISPLVFYDRVVLRVEPMLVNSISLTRGDAPVARARLDNDDGWKAVSPAGARVDDSAVHAVLSAAARVEASRIIHGGEVDFDSYGLGDPEIRLTLGFSGEGAISTTLMVGFKAGTDGVYAMVKGRDIVFVLSKEVVGSLVRSPVILPGDDPGSPEKP